MSFRDFRRHRGGYAGRRFGTAQSLQPEIALPPPSASQRKIEDIDTAKINLPPGDDASPKVQNVELVASFNWKEAKHTTILVPGRPPKWQPPSLPQSLREDHGVYFRDVNSAHYSTFPTEPAVRAILHESAQSSLLNADVFGCGNSFGCLLSVARNEERTFRFGVERIGSTLFLVRKTNTPRETIQGVYGYGHTFPEAYTIWEDDVKSSASHQRIIKYDFMGLKIIIRSECDGFLPDKLPPSELEPGSTISQGNVQEPDLDVLFPALGPNVKSHSSVIPKKLEITPSGRPIPQHAIFDLKTRSIKAKDRLTNDLEQFYPRLWANQTPNFILAYHQHGKFEQANIQIRGVTEAIQDWESRNSTVLRRFGSLLQKLIELSKVKGTARFEVRRTGNGPLELWSEVPGWSALPDELKEKLGNFQNGSEKDSGDEAEAQDREGGVSLEHDSSDEDEGDDAAYLKF